MTNFRCHSLIAVSLVMLAALLAGCAGMRPDPILRSGPGADFDSTQVTSFRESQDKVLLELYQSAGLAKDIAPTDAAGWGKVINAGMDYADQRCEAYTGGGHAVAAEVS